MYHSIFSTKFSYGFVMTIMLISVISFLSVKNKIVLYISWKVSFQSIPFRCSLMEGGEGRTHAYGGGRRACDSPHLQNKLLEYKRYTFAVNGRQDLSISHLIACREVLQIKNNRLKNLGPLQLLLWFTSFLSFFPQEKRGVAKEELEGYKEQPTIWSWKLAQQKLWFITLITTTCKTDILGFTLWNK